MRRGLPLRLSGPEPLPRCPLRPRHEHPGLDAEPAIVGIGGRRDEAVATGGGVELPHLDRNPQSEPAVTRIAHRDEHLALRWGTFAIDGLEIEGLGPDGITNVIFEHLRDLYEQKEKAIGAERLRYTERMILLQLLDGQWKDHLLSMDHLKEGISLRGYGQRDPLVEYKKESFQLFQDLMGRYEEEVLRFLFNLQLAEPSSAAMIDEDAETLGPRPVRARSEPVTTASGASLEDVSRDILRKKEREMQHVQMAGAGDARPSVKQVVRGQKVGRNQPCPCGSGKKYKKCCGRAA